MGEARVAYKNGSGPDVDIQGCISSIFDSTLRFTVKSSYTFITSTTYGNEKLE